MGKVLFIAFCLIEFLHSAAPLKGFGINSQFGKSPRDTSSLSIPSDVNASLNYITDDFPTSKVSIF